MVAPLNFTISEENYHRENKICNNSKACVEVLIDYKVTLVPYSCCARIDVVCKSGYELEYRYKNENRHPDVENVFCYINPG
jgi:hypothetical protein